MRVDPRSLSIPRDIDPVREYHIPTQLLGCSLEKVVLWEAYQSEAASVEDSSRMSELMRTSAIAAVSDTDQLPMLQDALNSESPPGVSSIKEKEYF
jgi:hypothetical protein